MRAQEEPKENWASWTRLRVLGRGHQGSAVLLKHPTENKLVVAKEVPIEQEQPQNAAKNQAHHMQSELDILKSLKHPGIIAYIDWFTQNQGILAIVMEYAPGGTLANAIAAHATTRTHFETHTVFRWLQELTSALQHVHSRRILHRDIKTANVFLTGGEKQHVKLGDFGVSRALSTETNLAETMCGTPYYLSPELIKGTPYAQPSDVWALGVVLFELLCLKRPFDAPNGALGALVMCISSGDSNTSALHDSPHPWWLVLFVEKHVNCKAFHTRGLLEPDAELRVSLEALSHILARYELAARHLQLSFRKLSKEAARQSTSNFKHEGPEMKPQENPETSSGFFLRQPSLKNFVQSVGTRSTSVLLAPRTASASSRGSDASAHPSTPTFISPIVSPSSSPLEIPEAPRLQSHGPKWSLAQPSTPQPLSSLSSPTSPSHLQRSTSIQSATTSASRPEYALWSSTKKSDGVAQTPAKKSDSVAKKEGEPGNDEAEIRTRHTRTNSGSGIKGTLQRPFGSLSNGFNSVLRSKAPPPISIGAPSTAASSVAALDLDKASRGRAGNPPSSSVPKVRSSAKSSSSAAIKSAAKPAASRKSSMVQSEHWFTVDEDVIGLPLQALPEVTISSSRSSSSLLVGVDRASRRLRNDSPENGSASQGKSASKSASGPTMSPEFDASSRHKPSRSKRRDSNLPPLQFTVQETDSPTRMTMTPEVTLSRGRKSPLLMKSVALK